MKSYSAPAGLLDGCDNSFSLFHIRRKVHDDGRTFAGEHFADGAPNSA
jgi:hypothetical protein